MKLHRTHVGTDWTGSWAISEYKPYPNWSPKSFSWSMGFICSDFHPSFLSSSWLMNYFWTTSKINKRNSGVSYWSSSWTMENCIPIPRTRP